MSTGYRFLKNEQSVTWLLLMLVVVLAAAGFLLLHTPPEHTQVIAPEQTVEPKVVRAGSSVELTRLDGGGADAVLMEEAILLDPTPMFLPTEWSSAQNALPASLIRRPGRGFENYPEKLSFQESGLVVAMPDVQSPGGPVDALLDAGVHAPFAGMGRSDWGGDKLAARAAVIEVARASDGGRVYETALTEAEIPASGWQPLEFLVAIGPAGLVGTPVIVQRSGREEVDRFFQNYLAKILRLGERLPPGSYHVLAGP